MKKIGICDHSYEGTHTYTSLCPQCESKLYGKFAELIGSEKQVSWAEDIRQQSLQELAKAILRRGSIDKTNEAGIKIAHKLAQTKDVKFWIDNRNISVNDLLKKGLNL